MDTSLNTTTHPKSQPTRVVPHLNTSLNLGAIIDKNRLNTIYPTEEDLKAIFHSNADTWSLEQLVMLSHDGISGFLRKDNELHACQIGIPLQRIDPRCYQRIGQSWRHHFKSLYHPFKSRKVKDSGEPVVILPIRGELFIHGQPLSDEQLQKIGLVLLRKDNQEPVTIPAFQIGGRGLLIPGSFGLPVIKTTEGGFRLINSEEEKPDLFLSGIAIHYGGTGMEYQYDLAKKCDDGSVALNPGEVILQGDNVPVSPFAAFIQRTDYDGKEGIFLDQRHEYYGDAPAGGSSDSATQKDLELDAELWAAGAIMGGVKVDAVSLVTEKELREMLNLPADAPNQMPCKGLNVSVRVYFKDTHRLSTITAFVKGVAKRERVECMRSAREAFKRFMLIYYGEDNPENRTAYLSRLGNTFGHNIPICIQNKLGLKRDQNTADNLMLVDGGIVDSENFLRLTNRYQILPLIDMWLSDLLLMYEIAEEPLEKFVLSSPFGVFLSKIFGGSSLAKLVQLECFKINTVDSFLQAPLFGRIIARHYIQERLLKERYFLNPIHLLHILTDSPYLQKRLDTGHFDRIRSNKESNEIELIQNLGDNRVNVRKTNFDAFLIGLAEAYIDAALQSHEPLFGGRANEDFERIPICQEIDLNDLNLSMKRENSFL